MLIPQQTLKYQQISYDWAQTTFVTVTSFSIIEYWHFLLASTEY